MSAWLVAERNSVTERWTLYGPYPREVHAARRASLLPRLSTVMVIDLDTTAERLPVRVA